MRRRGLICMGAMLFAAAPLQAAPKLGEAELRGKQIFNRGTGRSPIRALLVAAELEVDARGFPCASCHGAEGSGTDEGGVRAPDIRAVELAMPATALRGYGRDRPPYDPALLARTIRLGVDSAGNALHPGMPRYQIDDTNMADLLAYLRVLGDEPVPGVEEEKVRIGMLTPGGGALSEVAGLTRRVVQAFTDSLNERGGIYGRKLELVDLRFDPRDPGSAASVVRQALAAQDLFCFVAELGLLEDDPARRALSESGIPVIGALGIPSESSFNSARNVFYLHSSFADHARVLVDYLAVDLDRPEARVALLHSQDPIGSAAAAGFRSQLEHYSLKLVSEHSHARGAFDSTTTARTLEASSTDAVYFFGSGADLRSFVNQTEATGWRPLIFADASSAGSAVAAVVPEALGRVYLASPLSEPDLGSKGMREFLVLVNREGIPGRHKSFQLASYGAAALLREGLTRAGRSLTRQRLVSELEALWNFDPGVVPELTFDANRRVGNRGANILQLDAKTRAFRQVADWREPR